MRSISESVTKSSRPSPWCLNNVVKREPNHALQQRRPAVRSSVAGDRERAVHSTRAAEAVAELGSV
jgi:hypothetical protein